MTDTYATARAMIADLNAKRVSARELLDAHLARNRQVYAKINAIVETDIARAKKDAAAIDEARARGEKLGALAGLPMTIKDGFDVQNMPATSGNPGFKDRAKDCADAALVEAVRKAGAVIWGKSNVPFMLGDFQSYNAIYGTTNNPYDVTRVPAGSSGGAAAALATGVTPLEIGSDIGGSLRHPANYCGVTALKPTWGGLPLRGHVPPPPGVNAEVDLGVAGPMARNIEDLKLLWRVLKGTPAQPRRDIKGARIAVWDEEPGWPLAAEVKAAVHRAADAAARAGAHVEHAKPKIDGSALMQSYMALLMFVLSAQGGDIDAADKQRNTMKQALADFFAQGWDAILMPISMVPPFRHQQEPAFQERILGVDGVPAPYGLMLNWISVATALHAPAIAVQAGQTASGLPVGVQFVGPWNGEDRLFDFAAAVEDGLGGFKPPKI